MEKRKEYVKTHRIQSGLSCDLCEEILNEISYIFHHSLFIKFKAAPLFY